MNATYARLRDGSWGIRVNGSADPGAVVLATRRDNTSRYVTVGDIVWSGPDVTLARIAPAARRSRPAPAPVAVDMSDCPAAADLF